MTATRQDFFAEYPDFAGDGERARRRVLKLVRKQGYSSARGKRLAFEDEELIRDALAAGIVSREECSAAWNQGAGPGSTVPPAPTAGLPAVRPAQRPVPVDPGGYVAPHGGDAPTVYVMAPPPPAPHREVRVHNQTVVTQSVQVAGTGGPSFMVRLLYFCLIGCWWGTLWFFAALALCCTLIGLPLGLAMMTKTAKMFFL